MKKTRYIILALLIISMLAASLITGCTGKSSGTTTPARKYQIVKITDIVDSKNDKWKIYQLMLTLDGGATFTIDLNLADTNKVDCWYTTEKPTTGGSVDFKVKAGTDTVYQSSGTGAAGLGSTSDRLSFTAVKLSGTSYRLVFHNNLTDKNSKETIFTEIRYPATDSGEDSIFIPLETN